MPEESEKKEVQPLLLKDLVRQVRKELLEIVEENRKTNTESIFVVESVSLEVNITVGREQSLDGKAGANLYVIDLSSKAKKSDRTEHVHKVILNLSARAPKSSDDIPVASGGSVAVPEGSMGDHQRRDRGKMKLDYPSIQNELEKLKLGAYGAVIKPDVFPNKGASLE